jgi:hypothetical protein
MTIHFDTITNNYEVIYVIKTVMKYYLKKIDTSFHQRLPFLEKKKLLLMIPVLVKSVWLRNVCFLKVATILFKFIDRSP